MNVTWIASYPKSGNTWIRFMIYAAVYGQPNRSIDVTRKIPDIHRKLPFDPPQDGNLFAKSHLQLTSTHPMLDQSVRALHIIRNPADVLLSSLNYRAMTSGETNPAGYAEQFIHARGDASWESLGFGTWVSHAQSWRTTDRFPVLALRYEDIKADPENELTRILDFVGIERTPEQIKQAVRHSSFDEMRAMEIREKNAAKNDDLTKRLFVGSKKSASKGLFFMNKGKSNQSLDELAPGLDNRFKDAFAESLEQYGYSS